MDDKFGTTPDGITYFDGFSDALVSSFWSQVVTGAVTIVESAGKLTINHNAAGAIGSGVLSSVKRFGWQNTISVGIALDTGSLAADGNHAEASLVLYKDDTHYIKFGPYRDTAAAQNSLSCLRYKMTAGAETVLYLGTDIADTNIHRYSIVILDDHAVLAIDEKIVYDIETSTFVDYYAQLESVIPAVGDHVHAAFSNFVYAKNIDFLRGLLIPENLKHTFSGNITLANTNASEVTFDAATHGNQFELVLVAALIRGTTPKGVLNDGGAYTDYTSQCNDMVSGNIVMLPAVPANSDAFIVMATEKFCYIDVYMDGGVANTDNVLAIKYWNGAWTAISAVVDGTFDTQSLGKSGRVSFSPPNDWATSTIDGYTGYAVEFVVTAHGAVQPLATHIQLGLNSSSGFDQVAKEFSDLTFYVKSNIPGIGYQSNPTDTMVYAQSLGHRDISLNGFRCNGDTKIGFQLSDTPSKNVVIPYFGFTRRI